MPFQELNVKKRQRPKKPHQTIFLFTDFHKFLFWLISAHLLRYIRIKVPPRSTNLYCLPLVIDLTKKQIFIEQLLCTRYITDYFGELLRVLKLYCTIITCWEKLGFKWPKSPGWILQLVRESPWYAKVAGSIPSHCTCKNQLVNA